MGAYYTIGTWTPKAGEEEAFVQGWLEFTEWVRQLPGAGTLRLARDMREPTRLISFGEWDSLESIKGFKGSPEFRQRMGRLQQHVEHFEPSELEVVETVGAASVGA